MFYKAEPPTRTPAPSSATGASGNGEATTPDEDEVVEDADFEVIDDETATKA